VKSASVTSYEQPKASVGQRLVGQIVKIVPYRLVSGRKVAWGFIRFSGKQDLFFHSFDCQCSYRFLEKGKDVRVKVVEGQRGVKGRIIDVL